MFTSSVLLDPGVAIKHEPLESMESKQALSGKLKRPQLDAVDLDATEVEFFLSLVRNATVCRRRFAAQCEQAVRLQNNIVHLLLECLNAK